jgi:hypothetical protein
MPQPITTGARASRTRRRLFFAAALGSALSAACAGTPAREPASAAKRPAPENAARAALAGVPALEATLVTQVPAGTYGPYVGRSRDGALLAWAPEANGKRSWQTLALDPAGNPRGKAVNVGEAGGEIGLVALRGDPDGTEFTLVSTRRSALKEWVDVTLLRADGSAAGAPRSLAELSGRALWVESVGFGERRVVLWAVRSGDVAEIHAVALNARGEPKAPSRKLVEGVNAWQAVAFGAGTALGVVRRLPDGKRSVDVHLLDGAGAEQRAPVSVSAGGKPALDLDLGALGDRLLVTWSDSRDGENRVYRSLVAADGSISAPAAPVTEPVGEQVLVRTIAPANSSRAFVIWENLAHAGFARAFDVAAVDRDGRTGAERARVDFDSIDASVPEFAAAGDGLAALTLAEACLSERDCDDAEVMPTFVRLDAGLRPVASEPLRLSVLGGNPAELGWGLSCSGASCFTLSALSRSPAPVYVTRLAARSTAYVPAARALGGEAAPRIRENRVLANTEALSALALARAGRVSLSAYLTDFDPTTPWVRLTKPASDGRYDPLRARLDLVPLTETGTAGASKTLSLRAHSVGGVALAPNVAGTEVLSAWTGVDAGQPQVFITMLSPDGIKRNQRMLTRKTGDVNDVAAVALNGGYVVGWVDEREGDPEVYVTKVNGALNRVGNEQRLTQAAGPATELSLASVGERVVAVWAEARDPERPGDADIFVSRLNAKDLTPLAPAAAVVTTRGHSLSPLVRPFGDGVAIAWLERGESDEGKGAGLMFGVLDPNNGFKQTPALTPIEANPSSIALDCTATACNVVVTVTFEETAALFASVVRPGGAPSLLELVTLRSRAAAATRLSLVGNELLYADTDGGAGWRMRRALIDWQ